MNQTPIHEPHQRPEEKPENNDNPSRFLGGDAGADERAHLMDSYGLAGNTKLQRLANRLEALAGVEARGIQRVPPELKSRKATFADYFQVFLVWFSADLTANNIAIGLLANVYGLGLTDAMLVGTFGAMAGSAFTGYISTFGPISGNRTLVVARYTMGYWPSKIAVIFNIVVMLGYGLVDCLLAGQILSAVSPNGSLSIIVGTIIAAVISLVICAFGIKLFHVYERYALIPQVCMFFILVGVAGSQFNLHAQSTGTAEVLSADKLSFFFLSMSAPLAWSGSAADFFVYFPTSANRFYVGLCTTLGLGVATVFALCLGVGLSEGTLTNSAWAAANDVSAGALIAEAFTPLGTFGKFCAVIIALGEISNNIPGTYAASLGFQMLGRWLLVVPRLIWTIVGVVIYTVLACVGRNTFYDIFEDFLALMGYWTILFFVLTLEEEFIFRRKRGGYNWDCWNKQKYLPIGIAAFTAFCIGWAG